MKKYLIITAMLFSFIILGPITTVCAEESAQSAQSAPVTVTDQEKVSDLTHPKNAAHKLDLPPGVIDKLNAEQIMELFETNLAMGGSDKDPPKVAILVPLFFFIFVLGIVGASLYFSFRKERQRQETLRLMVEKGTVIPPEMLVTPRQAKSDLRRGVLLIAVGLGIIGLFGFTDPSNWAIGLLPTLIGLGYLLVWKLERKNEPANK